MLFCPGCTLDSWVYYMCLCVYQAQMFGDTVHKKGLSDYSTYTKVFLWWRLWQKTEDSLAETRRMYPVHKAEHPHLRKSAILRTTKSIAELRTKKSCGTAIADFIIWLQQFCNSLQSPADSATFWYLFLSSGWFYKSTKNTFRTAWFSKKPKSQKLASEGESHEIFYLRFFFMNPDQIPLPKICRKLRKWSSQVADLKLWTSENIAIAEFQSCGCGATFL